jgi:hypothetical protein
MTTVGPGETAPSSAAGTTLWITPRDGREIPKADGLLRYHLRDAADLVWSPVDAVLASRSLSNLIVLTVTFGVAALCVRDGGLDGLIINLSGLAVIWGAAYGLIRLGRWWRGVHPLEHVPRQLTSRPTPAGRRRLGQGHDDGVQGQADARSHYGAVDADELEVAA